MAIPIPWPSSDDVEDSYRSLDILLEQLLATVRQVLLQRRRQQQQEMSYFQNSRERAMTTQLTTTQPSEPFAETASEIPVYSESRLPLPDLVQDLATDCESCRRKAPAVAPVEAAPTEISTWVQVGAELRRIADDFRAERAVEQNNPNGKSRQLKEASLLSLLCPAFGRSVWTTVFLIVGWGLFSRTR